MANAFLLLIFGTLTCFQFKECLEEAPTFLELLLLMTHTLNLWFCVERVIINGGKKWN
ncbi:MAG: hypothetical protein ACRCZ9_04055 [Fusobacteriaceae bacterium]